MSCAKQLLIFGDSSFAEVAYECFTHDSDFEVIGFVVESAYITKSELFGLPVVPLEDLEKHFPSRDLYFYVALVYSQLNRLRTRIFLLLKSMGYRPASYFSSKASIWHNVIFGEHCFVFEDNTLQPFVRIGDNVVLWSGNHIGHHTHVHDNCFISSHVIVSGHCIIGAHSFLGVNSTLANNVALGKDNWIGPSTLVIKNTDDASLIKTDAPTASKISSLRFFKVRE